MLKCKYDHCTELVRNNEMVDKHIILHHNLVMHRLKITTPEQFEQFTAGQIGAGYDYVHFYAGAHPDVFSLPKVFANNTAVREFRFEDDNENVIYVDTGLSRVDATLKNGHGLIGGLPDHYQSYTLNYDAGASISADDYAHIFTWRSASDMQIYDNADVANELATRVHQMKTLDKLQILKLRLHLETSDRLRVRPFMVTLPALLILDFQIKGFEEAQARKFMASQKDIPISFRGVLYMHMSSIMYSKT